MKKKSNWNQKLISFFFFSISNFIVLLSMEMQGGKLTTNFEDDFFELDEE